MHYGILGMKWGTRRYQNKDGTWTAAGKRKRRAKSYSGIDEAQSKSLGKSGIHGPFGIEPDDFILKRGTVHYRVTTNPEEKFSRRMYVSNDPDYYLRSAIAGYGKQYYVDTLKQDKDVLVAGKKAIQECLDEIGSNHINIYDNVGTKEFLYRESDREIADKFIDSLRRKGYGALMDPADSLISDEAKVDTAMIFVEDILSKIDQKSV